MTQGGSSPAGASGACVLRIGDRVVLRTSGPPHAEYAMFEIGEIELRATEPARIRERGYQTTVDLARARLAALGATVAAAAEVARALDPVLSDAYARGSAVRRIARLLGPAELLQASAFDAAAGTYQGTFLDLATLTRDVAMDHAGATLQALHLAALLEREAADTPVELLTEACTRQGKPGARTYRRPSLADPAVLARALAALAERRPEPRVRGALGRDEVIAFLRARAELARDDDERALYRSLEGSVSAREMPERGPLASPELWALELRLDRGDVVGATEAVDELERRHGRSPGTTYLRARASLALGLESPAVVAGRASALAQSMPAFQELALLTAEAWLAADDPQRAIPYARDLVDQSGDDVLLARAERLLAEARAATGEERPTLTDAAEASVRAEEIARAPWSQPPADRPRPARRADVVGPPPLPPIDLDIPEVTDPHARAPSPLPPVTPSRAPPSSGSARPSRRPRLGGGVIETRPPPSYDPRAEQDSPVVLPRASVAPSREALLPPARPTSRPPRSTTSERPTLTEPDEAPPDEGPYMHGASLPPFQRELSPPTLAALPFLARGVADELAEHLALPLGTPRSASPIVGRLPATALEARVQFTLLARDLGASYRVDRGIELRADASAVEAMQAVLLASLPSRAVQTSAEAYELHRHGALFSEILARKLGAEWIDITPGEVGLWAMLVPPDTRVWPFGRLARLVAKRSDEPDLVQTYAELQARSRR